MKDDGICDMLLARGIVSRDQLHIATVEQQARPAPIGRILVSLGFLSEAVLRDATAEALDQRSIDLAGTVPDSEAIARLPRLAAVRHRVFPVSYRPALNTLSVAMADPLDILALDQIRLLVGHEVTIEPLLASETDIAQAIAQYYGVNLAVEGILRELETGHLDEDSLASPEAAYHHPVIRLVDALIFEAVKQGASDIHFEPEAGFVRVRYRVDGVLHQVRSLHGKHWPALAVRLKVMANLNIADTRSPQDGRITLALLGRAIDFRIATLPTLHGENIVLRILDRHRGILTLDHLGLSCEARSRLETIMARPEGMVLITGPTGSGKTTTLYSILQAIHSETVNIMTLEDPVEYPLTGIRQVAVNEGLRLDFASGVRAILRQDPDVVLIGEIRDGETAAMALRAAMTGHQVYSTLHANSALAAIPRLVDLGLRQESLAGNLIGIMAQRLVRRLCRHCCIELSVERNESAPGLRSVWQPVGCECCNYHGYRGRLALMEIVCIDDGLDALIAEGAPPHVLKKCARDQGSTSLAQDGLRLVAQGETSLEEVSRVVNLAGIT